MDLVGRVIEDRYEVLRKLGESQLGGIYEAKHVTLGRPVTIEVLGPALASSEAARACFLRQARQASRLRHRGIVEVEHQGATPNGSVYLASEPLPGTTLDAVLRRETKLPWSRARGIALQIAAALKAAHRRSVVHQGLRPGLVHLWIDEDGSERLKVAGFGMAEVGAQTQRQPEEDGATTRLCGDGRYMPPEQVIEGRGSVQGDVYALGAVLHHVLTGEPPVSRSSVFQLVARQGRREIVPARRKEPAIPEAVEASLMRALAVEAGDRHESMQELERELQEVDTDAVGSSEVTDAARADDDVATGNGGSLHSRSGPAAEVEASEVIGPPLLVSSTRVAAVREEEATTMISRSQVGAREDGTMMLERMPARGGDGPPVEATELLAVGQVLVTAQPIQGKLEGPPSASAARSPEVAAHRPVLAAVPPAPAIARAAAPAPSSPPVRSFDPNLGRPLPDAPPPDRTWLVAIVAAMLVAMGGVAIGLVIANASEPDREVRGGKPSKAAQEERRR